MWIASFAQRSFFAPNGAFTREDADAVRTQFERLLPAASAVCLCGSAPAPEAAVLFPELLAMARRRGLHTLLDSSGLGLKLGVAAAPHVVKANLAEASALLGRTLATHEDQTAALDALRRWGSDWAVLTLGEQGALFAAGRERWSARPPEVPVVNPIGAGTR